MAAVKKKAGAGLRNRSESTRNRSESTRKLRGGKRVRAYLACCWQGGAAEACREPKTRSGKVFGMLVEKVRSGGSRLDVGLVSWRKCGDGGFRCEKRIWLLGSKRLGFLRRGVGIELEGLVCVVDQSAVVGRENEVLQGPLGLCGWHELVGASGPEVGLGGAVLDREGGFGRFVEDGDLDADFFARKHAGFVAVKSAELLGRDAEDQDPLDGVLCCSLVDQCAEGRGFDREPLVVGDERRCHPMHQVLLIFVGGSLQHASNSHPRSHQGAVHE